ncbi:hypothetical protein GGF44_002668, partial [Coemansia sp. RSA 1694]
MFRVTSAAARRAQPLQQLLLRSSTSAARAAVSFSTTAAAKQGEEGGEYVSRSLHTLSEDEQMMRDAVSRFARDVVQPRVSAMDEAEAMDASVIRGLFEAGLMGVETSVDHGGAGASFTSAIIAVEELAKIDPSVSVLCDVHNTLVNTVFRTYASKELQQKYLPRLAADALGCFCLSEAAAGSDAFALQTRATPQGPDGYVINGAKMWITNSNEADVFLVFATVDPALGYRGITCFAVDRETPGVTVAKKEKKLGIRASSTCQVSFDDVRVPAANVVGE